MGRHRVLSGLRQTTHSQSVRLLPNNPRRASPLYTLSPLYSLIRMPASLFWLVIKIALSYMMAERTFNAVWMQNLICHASIQPIRHVSGVKRVVMDRRQRDSPEYTNLTKWSW